MGPAFVRSHRDARGPSHTGKQVAVATTPSLDAPPNPIPALPQRADLAATQAPSFPQLTTVCRARAPPAARLKAPSSRSRRGRPAPGGLLPAESCIVKDRGGGRKSEQPPPPPQVCARADLFYSAEHTQTTPKVSEGKAAGLRAAVECGTQSPSRAHRHLLTAGGREFRDTVPQTSGVSLGSVGAGAPYPSTGEIQD